jgi:hypothetical protein
MADAARKERLMGDLSGERVLEARVEVLHG